MSEEGRTKRIRKNTRKIGEKQEEKRRGDGEGERGETILGCKTSTLLEEEELYLIIFYLTVPLQELKDQPNVQPIVRYLS